MWHVFCASNLPMIYQIFFLSLAINGFVTWILSYIGLILIFVFALLSILFRGLGNRIMTLLIVLLRRIIIIFYGSLIKYLLLPADQNRPFFYRLISLNFYTIKLLSHEWPDIYIFVFHRILQLINLFVIACQFSLIVFTWVKLS